MRSSLVALQTEPPSIGIIGFFNIDFFDLPVLPAFAGSAGLWIKTGEYKDLGERLASLRKRTSITQKELALRLKKPQSFVSSYENGQRRLDLLEFTRIVEALRLDAVAAFKEVMAKKR